MFRYLSDCVKKATRIRYWRANDTSF